MSEIKRVTLTTLEPQKVSDKVNKKQFRTVRISVILPESNEDNCPEYNYKDQLAAVKKKSKQVKEPNCVENGLDPFDNDDDVKRIALEMEAKYGTGVTSTGPNNNNNNNNRRKRKGRKDDYADIGMGYDESDSFIDNTDGYDEIIPQNVTTLHGGFYINCGALEFKTDDDASSAAATSSSSSESSEDEQDEDVTEGGAGGSGEEEKPKKSKKRVLDSSSSDSETVNTSQAEKKLKLQTVKTTMHQAIKKKLFSSEKIQVKKKIPADPLKKTVKDLLREKREDLDMSVPAELKESEENVEKDSLKENKKPMSISSVTDAIESVVKHVVEAENYDKNQNRQSVNVNTTELSINKNVAEIPQMAVNPEPSQDVSKVPRPEVIKLPENLPVDITEIVEKIKTAGTNYKGEGKKAFFTNEVNSLLLNLERKCRVLGKSSRLRVYEYLSSFVVVCKKDTLMKRARSLILDQEESRLRKLEVELKDKIDYVMPSLTVKFEQECQAVLAKKFSKEGVSNDEVKALKMPRRKFPWTDESRRLIKDILSFKKRCLLREGKQKDKLEEQVVNYLKTVILPFWPEGWMYLNNLKKVYNSMTSDNRSANSSANSSVHSNSVNATTIAPTTKSDVPNKSEDSTVKTELSKQPKEKPVDVYKSYPNTEKHLKPSEKSPPHPEKLSTKSSKPEPDRPKTYAENTVKAHADSSESKFQTSASDLSRPAKRPSEKSSKPDEGPSDLSMTSKMFKPYAENSAPTPGKPAPADAEKLSKPPEMFKPYVEQAMAELFGMASDLDAAVEAPSDLSRHAYKSPDKSKVSQFEMFKPYADSKAAAAMNSYANHRPKDKGKSHGEFAATPSSSKHKEARNDGSSKNAHRLKDVPTLFEDSATVIIKASQDAAKERHSPLPLPAHCRGIDLSDRTRKYSSAASPDAFAAADFLAANFQSHRPAFPTQSTPKISKSEGDDIQMVMENLKALQKLSCSPVKNDANSSSSPASVIAFNKAFAKGAADSGQDEFQKQFVSSLQQMQANAAAAGAAKSGYNRCS